MSETTFEIQVPNNLLQFGLDRNQIQAHVNEWLVLSLYTEGHVSSGKAAKLLNITRVAFLALLRKRGISYIDMTEEELVEEIDAVSGLNIDLTK